MIAFHKKRRCMHQLNYIRNGISSWSLSLNVLEEGGG